MALLTARFLSSYIGATRAESLSNPKINCVRSFEPIENPSMCLEMGIRANKHIVDNYNMSLLTKLNINFYKEIINEF